MSIYWPRREARQNRRPQDGKRAGQGRGRGLRLVVTLCAMLVAGCSSLPSSAPTEGRIRKAAGAPNAGGVPYRLVPINVEVARSGTKPADLGVVQLAALPDNTIYERTDAIRIGDRLSLSIYEVGVTLFRSTIAASPDPLRAPAAGVQNIVTRVREDGSISLPYVGDLNVVGLYPDAVARMIRDRLRPLSESPEVLVEISESLENAVYIGGAVSRSGRYNLTSARERLLDALAIAGGSPIDVNELQLTLVRGNTTVVVPLNQIQLGDPANIVLRPGDRIALERVRKTYTVFGASDRINQIGFDARTVSLAEALARAGGPSDARANPRGVFVFRLEKDEAGELLPTVYQLDMMRPESYFLAQMFPMQDKDVILIANSSSNITQKLINLVNQLFSPILAVRYAAD